MSGVRIALLMMLLLVIQSSLIPFLALPLARPDLVLLLTIYVGLASGPEKSTLTGFFAGIGQDASSGEIAGLHPFAKSLVGFLCPWLRRFFIVPSFFVHLVAVAALTGLHAMILFGMGQAIRPTGLDIGATDFFARTAGPEILSNLLFCALLYPVLRRLLPPPERD